MTDNDFARWRKLADRRLAALNAIAQIGAEPPDAVLAIIRGEDPDPAAGTSDTSTWNHPSLDRFRRELMTSYHAWRKIAGEYRETARDDRAARETSSAAYDAYAGSLMAASYVYTLAAVLGEAEREFGPQTARRLASVADEVLTDGDPDDLNADVMPGTPLPPPTPAEQVQAGQLAL